jgi:hypothetical protein
LYKSTYMPHVFESDLAHLPSVAKVQQLAVGSLKRACLPLGPDQARRHATHLGDDANRSRYIVFHADTVCTAPERSRDVQSLLSHVHISLWTGHLVRPRAACRVSELFNFTIARRVQRSLELRDQVSLRHTI